MFKTYIGLCIESIANETFYNEYSKREITVDSKDILSLFVRHDVVDLRKVTKEAEYKTETQRYRSFWFYILPTFWLIPRSRQVSICVEDEETVPVYWNCSLGMRNEKGFSVSFTQETIDELIEEMKEAETDAESTIGEAEKEKVHATTEAERENIELPFNAFDRFNSFLVQSQTH